MRKAAIAAAVLVLVLVLAAVVLPRLVSLDTLKPRIVAALEQKTGRKVGLARISLALFPGIGVRITGLSVSGDRRHPGDVLLSVPEGEIRVAIAPLFSGHAEFSTFVLTRPRILFRKYADGTHSAADILDRLAAPEKPPVPGSPPPAGKVRVAVRSVRIEDAALSLRMEEKDGREATWEISPLTVRLSGIGGPRSEFEVETKVEGAVRGAISFRGVATRAQGAVTAPPIFDIAGKGAVFGQPVTVTGKISAPDGIAEADLAVALPKIRMDAIPGIFADPPAVLRDGRPEGVAAVTVKVSGNLQTAGFEVDADLTRAGWGVGETVRKFIDAPCTVVVQGRRVPDQLLVSNAELRLAPLLVIANARYVPSTGAGEWAASARISSLAGLAGSPAGGLLRQWAPSGRLTASGRGTKASATAPEDYAAAIDLGDAGFHVPQRRIDVRGLDGHVELSPKGVSFTPLTGLINGQRFTLRGNAALGAAPAGQVDIWMAYLDLDALFPPGGPAKAAGGETKVAPAPRAKGPAKMREVSARAALAIDAGKARGIEFRKLSGSARYEKEVLSLDSMRALVYGGEAAVTGRVLLSGPAPDFRVKVTLKDVRAEEILSRKTSLKDLVSGSVFLSADVAGGARDFADFARTASGAGSIRVADGKIRGVDLLSAAEGLVGLPGVPATASGARAGGGGETKFSDLSADFRVGGGKIRTDTLKIVSDKLALTGAAAIGFDKTLDFRGALRLSKELSSRVRGRGGKFLVGPSGQVEIPLVMSGPVGSPAVAVDTEALARGAAGRLLQGLTEKIPGAAAIPDNAAPGAAGKKGEEPARGVEKLLRQLLPGG